MDLSAPSSSVVRDGDAFILYLCHDGSTHHLTTNPDSVVHTRVGSFHGKDFVGAHYGTKVHGVAQRKVDAPPSAFVLRFTPVLWTDSMPHRTQIIYQTDIALIVGLLELKPGSRVAEAGTGSGSLTHSLAQAVIPNGAVYTCDFNRVRVEAAAAEFALHGLKGVVIGKWSDVCPRPAQDDASSSAAAAAPSPEPAANDDGERRGVGFGVPTGHLDAVFLDVPSPWLSVPLVADGLKSGGRFCSFSPCIEQTQRLCDAVRATKEFLDIRTVEVLCREYNVATRKRSRSIVAAESLPVDPLSDVVIQSKPVGRGHTAYLTFCKKR